MDPLNVLQVSRIPPAAKATVSCRLVAKYIVPFSGMCSYFLYVQVPQYSDQNVFRCVFTIELFLFCHCPADEHL